MRSMILWLFLAIVLSSASLIIHFAAPSRSFQCGSTRSVRSAKKKHSSIVQDAENAGEGISGRLQCSSNKKNSTWNPSTSCSQQIKITVVSLFIPPAAQSHDLCDDAIAKSERSYSILRAFTESARLIMPASEQVLLTDQKARIFTEKLLPGIAVERIPGNYSRGNLMLQRLQSYIAFLNKQLQGDRSSGTGDFIFADSDMIFVGDLGCVFADHANFDVALTFRNNKEQPINSGMVFVRGTDEGLMKAMILLEEVLDIFRSDFAGSSRMMGDQLAFAKVVTKKKDLELFFRRGKEFEESVGNGVKVLFLPCSSFNWTPAEGAGQFHGMPLDVKVIHFKGSRKRLMLEAWELHGEELAFNNNAIPLACYVLRSGRSKYDF